MWLKLTNNGTYLIDTSKIKNKELKDNSLIVYNTSGTKDVYQFENRGDALVVNAAIGWIEHGSIPTLELSNGKIEPA